jgi:hypothetical protein
VIACCVNGRYAFLRDLHVSQIHQHNVAEKTMNNAAKYIKHFSSCYFRMWKYLYTDASTEVADFKNKPTVQRCIC